MTAPGLTFGWALGAVSSCPEVFRRVGVVWHPQFMAVVERTRKPWTVARMVSMLGAGVLVGMLFALMFLIGFGLGSTGLSWLGGVIVVAIFGTVLWRILK